MNFIDPSRRCLLRRLVRPAFVRLQAVGRGSKWPVEVSHLPVLLVALSPVDHIPPVRASAIGVVSQTLEIAAGKEQDTSEDAGLVTHLGLQQSKQPQRIAAICQCEVRGCAILNVAFHQQALIRRTPPHTAASNQMPQPDPADAT